MLRTGLTEIVRGQGAYVSDAEMSALVSAAVAAPHYGRGHRPHCPPPPPPRYHVVHHTHHHGDNAGWVALGAAAVGAVIGGLIGAAH